MRAETPAEQLLYATVRIEIEGYNPNEKGAGTAFIFGLEGEEGTFLCLVTNKHVIKGAKVGRFFFTHRKNDGPDVGNRFDIVIDNFERLKKYCSSVIQAASTIPRISYRFFGVELLRLLFRLTMRGNLYSL